MCFKATVQRFTHFRWFHDKRTKDSSYTQRVPLFSCICNPVFSSVEPHWRAHLNITTALKGGKHPARTETQAWREMEAPCAVLPSPFSTVAFSVAVERPASWLKINVHCEVLLHAAQNMDAWVTLSVQCYILEQVENNGPWYWNKNMIKV